jgi:hypothetical protein
VVRGLVRGGGVSELVRRCHVVGGARLQNHLLRPPPPHLKVEDRRGSN